jgi:hypothetical protein
MAPVLLGYALANCKGENHRTRGVRFPEKHKGCSFPREIQGVFVLAGGQKGCLAMRLAIISSESANLTQLKWWISV